jgi:hypothetical protein
MTTSSVWSLSFVAAVLVVRGASADFKFSLEPPMIQPGQRATLTLRLPESDLILPEKTDDEDIVPEAQDEWLIKTDGLELLEQDYRKEKGVYVWRYEFTGYTQGVISIPPISVSLGPQSFSTERTTLTVVSDRPEKDGELRPDAGQVSPPIDRVFWFCVGLIVLLGAAAYFFRKRLKLPAHRKVQMAPAEPPPENPVDWLRKQLLILRAKVDTHPEDTHSADAWTAVLREFAARQMHLPVLAWTTREMRVRLQSDPKYAALNELMQRCDRYKFTADRDGHKAELPAKVTLQWIAESEKLFL